MSKHHGFSLVALAAIFAAGPAASSQWPASVVGTWAAVTGTTASQLAITSQGSATPCAGIAGSMTDAPSGTADTIEGFYCRGTGRIVFARRPGPAAEAFGIYTGSLSSTGPTLVIGGTFAQEQAGFAIPVGEYGFHAQQ